MTTPSSRLLDRDMIEQALRRLGELLAARGVVADVYVVGGAAMLMAYDARRATRDIDAVFQPHGVVTELARTVALELNLPRHWLNDQASVYVSRLPDPTARRVFDHPGLRVSAASAEHMLAMKALAGRRYADRDDLHLLVRMLGLTRIAEVEAVCAAVFPEEQLTVRARLLLAEVLDEVLAEHNREQGTDRGDGG